MGGPCFEIIEEDNKGEPGTKKYRSKRGPSCTDNFLIRSFSFRHPVLGEEKEWYSVEQCYQALKFTDKKSVEIILNTKPFAKESSVGYGNRVWRIGQKLNSMRRHWEKVRVEIMYHVNRAKYAQHSDLRQELLSTENLILYG
mmetsp:Transcript_2921/g.3445  ORF Transcript_2921/g.3445 Transcript_2921/m.3445 type:complete len:142 (-) Transcript_2921:341-766(-)